MNVQIQLGGDESESMESIDVRNERRRFLLAWAYKGNNDVPKSNLLCPRCQDDPTQTREAKMRKFTQSSLTTHIISDAHSREVRQRSN